jgi:hypothetical protein
MKTRNIKEATLNKCLKVLKEMKYRADNNLPMRKNEITKKYHTGHTIPSAAKLLNYFEIISPNKWICKKERFDPINARYVLNFVYGYYRDQHKVKSYIKDQPKDLFPLHKPVKEIEDKIRVDFIPPTIQEIKDFCKFKDIDIDAKHFHSYYESVGWLVGKKKMQKWKSAIHTWERSKYNKVFVKGEISNYSNEEISKEFKKRGLSEKLNEYSDNELIDELKKRGFSGGIKKDISF